MAEKLALVRQWILLRTLSARRLGVTVKELAREMDVNLLVGIEDCRAVFITYQSMRATEPVTYDIYPYGLIYHRGALYVVGRSVERNEICHWKVARIEEAELTQIRFQRPEGFDLRQHLAGSFGVYHGDGDVRVKVRFAASAARYVAESKWHDSQRLTLQKDGSLLAEFHLSDSEEIKRWILSFGPAAVVVSPESLRKELAGDLRAMLRDYAGTKRVNS